MIAILITSDGIIKEIQQQFQLAFPFLRIEFLRKGFHPNQSVHRTQFLTADKKFGCAFTKEPTLAITPSMTVRELVSKCDEKFRIQLLVYRKAGNTWLETTRTDNWTIRQQNEYGGENFFADPKGSTFY